MLQKIQHNSWLRIPGIPQNPVTGAKIFIFIFLDFLGFMIIMNHYIVYWWW